MRIQGYIKLLRANRESGFSIIELMVAMGLSMLLLIGVITVFSSSRSTYEVSDRIARLQENGRFALDAVVRDIREAGYQGCTRDLPGNAKSISTLNQPAAMALITGYTTSPAVFGLNYTSAGTWTPALDTAWITGAVNGSDIIIVRRPKPNTLPVIVSGSMALPTSNIIVPATASFAQGDIALIDDCKMRTFFQVTAFDTATGTIHHDISSASSSFVGNATADLGETYIVNAAGSQTDKGDATIVPMQTVIYFIRASTSGTGTSLWRRVDAGTPEELAEGIEALQFLYGIDNDGNGEVDQYVTANAVTNPAEVIAVSTAILVRSIDTYGTIDADITNYNLLGSTFVAPGDRRLRQVFSATTAIRNYVNPKPF
jgi:type IV pilus assembly protein PilW